MLSRLIMIRTFGASAAMAVLLVTTSLASASGVGALYGARDPRTCPAVKVATLTASLARKLFICGSEQEVKSGAGGDNLYLVSDVKVEIGASRPYNGGSDAVSDIDPRKPVYPIRGSFRSYQCGALGHVGNPKGANCNTGDNTVARGICYNDTFGDWHCSMTGNVLGSAMVGNQPPPSRP